VDAAQARSRDQVLDHLDRVVLHDAQVAELASLDHAQQAAHSRGVHLDAEVVDLRIRSRDLRRRVAHAESDLQHHRRVAPEHMRKIERCGLERYAVAWKQALVRGALRIRHAALAQHIASNGALLVHGARQ
jgi:hypothetical protein